MKESVRNSRRGRVHLWWVAFGLVVISTACTDEGSDALVGSGDAMGPAPSVHSDWQVPGLVDRSGKPIEVPTPGPTTGRTLDVTHFGADPDPDSKTTQQPSGRP